MGSLRAGRRVSVLVLLIISVALLSAAMANGIRTGVVGAGARAPAVISTTPTATQVTTTPPAATAAAAVASDEQAAPLDDPYKDNKRKVPNGPDPIHNRRARWGEAPARRV